MLAICSQPPRQPQTHVDQCLSISQIDGIDKYTHAILMFRKNLIEGAVEPRAERLSDIAICDGYVSQSGCSVEGMCCAATPEGPQC